MLLFRKKYHRIKILFTKILIKIFFFLNIFFSKILKEFVIEMKFLSTVTERTTPKNFMAVQQHEYRNI